mgnify:CR=1 FL=1
MKRVLLALAVSLSVLLLSGCGYNAIQSGDEGVKAAWAEVLNQYQRRSDLIPNLVRTVQGFAQQEREVLIQGTTDAASMQLVQAGVKAGCVSIPTRYIHTTSECIHLKDLQAAVDLLAAWLDT